MAYRLACTCGFQTDFTGEMKTHHAAPRGAGCELEGIPLAKVFVPETGSILHTKQIEMQDALSAAVHIYVRVEGAAYTHVFSINQWDAVDVISEMEDGVPDLVVEVNGTDAYIQKAE